MIGNISKGLRFCIADISIKTYLLLATICILGYWAIGFDVFSLKSDAIRYFLPYRYNISNAIQSGQFPLWSPYIYMGFPIHGDMQSGVWNPVVLIISLFTRYNLSVLHAESLLYIFLAGVGVFKLLGEFGIDERVKTLVAVSYMFCGFITDSGQFIVWLASAAFLPFVFTYYYRLLYHPGTENAIKTSIALYLLLAAGYPSILIYCSYILLAAFFVRVITLTRVEPKKSLKQILITNGLMVIIFLCLAAPALISYIDLLPLYSRGSAVSLQEALINPFCERCSISFVLPFAVSTSNEQFATDDTMRNSYVGLFAIVFFLSLFQFKLNGIQKFVLVITLFTFLFSLGDATPIRKWCYQLLPLMNYFRHPANMRLFTSLGILLLASFAMDRFWKEPNGEQKKYIMIGSFVILGIILAFVLTHLRQALLSDATVPSLRTNGLRQQLKSILNSFSYSRAIVLQGTIQTFLIFLFIAAIQKNKKSTHYFISFLIILDVMGNAQLAISSTFVSKESPGRIDNFIAQYPTGFPSPALTTSLNDNTKDELTNDPIAFGYAGFYNKKVEILENVYSPCTLNSLGEFLNSKKIREIVSNYPVVYFSDSVINPTDTMTSLNIDPGKKYVFLKESYPSGLSSATTHNSIVVTKFHTNVFSFNVTTTDSSYMNVFQNYNDNWNAFLDAKRVPVVRSNISSMSVLVPPGTHNLTFSYRPYHVYIGLMISLLTCLILVFVFFLKKQRGKNIYYAV